MQYTDEQVSGAVAVVEREGSDFRFGKPDERDFIRMVQRGAGLPELHNDEPALEALAEEVYEDMGQRIQSPADLARFVLERLAEPPAGFAYVTTPSSEQLEEAWWNLMQGEMGVDYDEQTREDVQSLLAILRRAAERQIPIMNAEGEPLKAVAGDEVARRIAHAYADLFYGRA